MTIFQDCKGICVHSLSNSDMMDEKLVNCRYDKNKSDTIFQRKKIRTVRDREKRCGIAPWQMLWNTYRQYESD